MLYVRYVHLTRPSIFVSHKPIFSSERMLHKNYNKGSVEKIPVHESRGASRQDELTGGKPTVAK
jgi:hypothetical protein